MKKECTVIVPYLTPEYEGSDNYVMVGGRLKFGPTDHRRIKRTVRRWAKRTLGQSIRPRDMRAFLKCVN